ncbi:MAG: AMP-binding protein, partial [bacterium]|nr:AMP-binding protein [bacterium]
TAPRDKIEEKLVEIWRDILDISPTGPAIGIDDDFFRLGGHSLKATVLASRIRKELEVNITLSEIFTTPFIRGLAAAIADARPEKYTALEPVETKEYYPTSSAQRRLYVLQQMDQKSVGYNLPMIWQVTGSIDRARIEGAFQRLVQRHESLRTSFYMMKDKTLQWVRREMTFELCRVDPHRLMEDFVRPFDLSNAPLLRAGLVEKGERDYLLLMDMHHIISDGGSMQVLINDFTAFYADKHLPSPPLQYRDFSQWQNSPAQKEVMKRQEAYWLKQFGGDIPVLNLPADYPRPSLQGFEGNTIDFLVSGRDYDLLTSLSRTHGVTLYMALLSIFTILLAKLGGQQDIVVGSPIAGRGHVGLENIIGMFVNTLALRNFPDSRGYFHQFLEELKKRTLDSFENQDYQYEDLVEKVVVERDTSRNPLFDTMLILQNQEMPDIEIPGLKLTSVPFERGVAKFDLMLACDEANGRLACGIEYSTQLFKQETVQRFIRYFKTIIPAVCDAQRVKISEIEIITEEEKQQLLVDFNDTASDYLKDKTIHQLFEEQFEKKPGHCALTGKTTNENGVSITYSELNRKADELARELTETGAGAETIVAVMTDRSLEMVIGIFGILKAGAAYLPIDPDYPEERVRFMLEDSGTKIILTNGLKVDGLDGLIVKRLNGAGEPTNKPINRQTSKPINQPTNLCYVFYTSGSTGKPKGVMIEHRNIVAFQQNMTKTFGIIPSDIVYALTTYTFDISVLELIGSLLSGTS